MTAALLNSPHNASGHHPPECNEDEIAVVVQRPYPTTNYVERECIPTDDYDNAVLEVGFAEGYSQGFTEGAQSGWNAAIECLQREGHLYYNGCDTPIILR